MSAFELALVTLNLVIAIIYASILWVMVQQQSLMDRQLSAMQGQLREAERTRMAAHRPILRVELPILVSPIIVTVPPVPQLLPVELRRLRNIGIGVALDVRYFVHEFGSGVVGITGSLDPIGAGELSREFPVPSLKRLPPNPALTVTYTDVFGNRYWTLYHFASQSHSFGEGEPVHLKR